MNERDVLVNRLLDKYEKSAHLLTPGRSTRRVLLNVEKKDIPEYDYEYAPVRDAFNAAAKALEEQQLVCIEWADNRMVMQKIAIRITRASSVPSFCSSSFAELFFFILV